MKNIFATILIGLSLSAFSQNGFYLKDIYEKIDSVQLTQDEEKYQLVLIASQLNSTSRTWTSIASQLCIYKLQQMEMIPLRSDDMLLAILYCPVSDFESDEKSKVTFFLPQVKQFNFVLLPRYRRICEYSIDNFQPSEIETFENIVAAEILDNESFDYQELLFNIARTNQKDPDEEIANTIESIKNFFASNEKLDDEISNFLVEEYDDVLNEKTITIDFGN